MLTYKVPRHGCTYGMHYVCLNMAMKKDHLATHAALPFGYPLKIAVVVGPTWVYLHQPTVPKEPAMTTF